MPLRLLPGCPTDAQLHLLPTCVHHPVQRSSPQCQELAQMGAFRSHSLCPMCYHVLLSLCSKYPPLSRAPLFLCRFPPLYSCPPPGHSPPSMWAVSETRACSCCCPGLEPSSLQDLQDGAHTVTHHPAQLPSQLLAIAPNALADLHLST